MIISSSETFVSFSPERKNLNLKSGLPPPDKEKSTDTPKSQFCQPDLKIPDSKPIFSTPPWLKPAQPDPYAEKSKFGTVPTKPTFSTGANGTGDLKFMKPGNI